MASNKKPRAAPTSNPLGLTAREIEIAIFALRCTDDDGKLNKQELCILAGFGNAESAGRQYRRIMDIIKKATVEPIKAPGTPGGPSSSKSGDDAAAAAAADPESPSLLASQKKKNKASGGKVAGRKRTMKDADDGDNDGGVAGERPSKIPKHIKGNSIFTMKKDEAAEGSADGLDAGEI